MFFYDPNQGPGLGPRAFLVVMFLWLAIFQFLDLGGAP